VGDERASDFLDQGLLRLPIKNTRATIPSHHLRSGVVTSDWVFQIFLSLRLGHCARCRKRAMKSRKMVKSDLLAK
jgi:hypothetical protein